MTETGFTRRIISEAEFYVNVYCLHAYTNINFGGPRFIPDSIRIASTSVLCPSIDTTLMQHLWNVLWLVLVVASLAVLARSSMQVIGAYSYDILLVFEPGLHDYIITFVFLCCLKLELVTSAS